MSVCRAARALTVGTVLGASIVAPAALGAQSVTSPSARPPGAALRGVPPADSARAAERAPFFTRRETIAAGAFVAGTAALLPFDERIARWFQRPALQHSGVASDVATGARVLGIPGTLVIAPALYVAGRLGHHEHAAELGLYGSEAIVVALGTTLLIKGVAGRARPYVVHDADATDFRLGRGFPHREDYSSFASDHAAAAFALASATTSETSRWWPGSRPYLAPLLFGGATVVALSRVYDDKHWASDVVMGAAIGTVSGWTVVRYNHAHPRDWVNRWLLSATVLPAPSGGALVLWSFPMR